MIRSMTGFGSATVAAGDVDVSLEIRSVNSRHVKVNFRLPPGTDRWEEVLRKEISSRVRRGHVDVTLRLGAASGATAAEEGGSEYRLDEARARAFVEALREVQAKYDLPGEIDIDLVARCDRLLIEAPVDPSEAVSDDDLRRAAAAALDQLIDMRAREGKRLADDLAARVDALHRGLREVEALVPLRLERETARLRRSIGELAVNIEVDEDRLAREIAFIADKWDVSEELVRARAHLEAFAELLEAPSEEPVGKRLSFLGQELLREVNTIGSKANDAGISRLVVEMKNELESLREQNENVE